VEAHQNNKRCKTILQSKMSWKCKWNSHLIPF
jgi:hypothetical protein